MVRHFLDAVAFEHVGFVRRAFLPIRNGWPACCGRFRRRKFTIGH